MNKPALLDHLHLNKQPVANLSSTNKGVYKVVLIIFAALCFGLPKETVQRLILPPLQHVNQCYAALLAAAAFYLTLSSTKPFDRKMNCDAITWSGKIQTVSKS